MKSILYAKATPYLILFSVCAVILLRSPLAPFARGVPGIDSSVFIYTTQQVMKGKLLYKEVFDHKGPTLYLLHAIGLKILNGNWSGIWLLQMLCYFVTSAFLYKTLRFFFNKKISVLSIVTVLLYQGALEYGGNTTETWALPFTSIALYIFTLYFVKQKRFSVLQLLALSVTFILTLFLRPNLIAVWGIFGIVVIFDLVQSKRWKEILSYAFFILVFCLLSVFPFFMYAYLKGIIQDSIYSIFLFNMEYSSAEGISGFVLVFLKTLRTMGRPSYVYLSIILLTYILYVVLYFKEIYHKKYTVAIVGSILLIALSCSIRNGNQYYFVQFVPVLMFPIAACFSFFAEKLFKRQYTFTIFFFLILNFFLIFETYIAIRDNYKNDERAFYIRLSAIISQYTDRSDKILEMGNDLNVYLFSNRESSSKYPFIFPIIENDKLRELYLAELENKPRPKLIITDWSWQYFGNNSSNKLKIFLQDNYENLDLNLVRSDGNSYSIWKLKE